MRGNRRQGEPQPGAIGARARSFLNRFSRTWGHPWVAIALLMAGALVVKMVIMQPAALGTIWPAILKHDALVFSAFLGVFALALLVPRVAPRAASAGYKVLALVALLIVAIYVADVFVYWFFVTRLYVADLLTFSGESHAAFSLIKTAYWIAVKEPLWKPIVIGALSLLLLRSVWKIVSASSTGPHLAKPVALGALGFAGLGLLPDLGNEKFYGDKPLYENVFQRNVSFFKRASYSDEFVSKLVQAPAQTPVCLPGRGRPINIVVVVVESLSAYHSKLFSGIQDWTPMLDRMAGEGTALLNFHANGWTTIGGLIPLFSGAMPIVPDGASFNEWGSARFSDFQRHPRPVAAMLASMGYATSYVAAGDLGFMGKGDWLRTAGFQRTIGDSDPRMVYDGIRGPFHSVPDRLLYKVATDERNQLKAGGTPYLLVIQTYWSHRPFLSPDGEQLNGEGPVIREADDQLGRFYESLRADGFFKNGLLFVTGDHRAMEPFHEAETARFGASRVSRIPGVLVTNAVDLPKEITQDFQLRDFPASIESLVKSEFCIGPVEGSFLLATPKPPRCILHARGDDRDLVSVKCGTQEGTIRIAGNATAFESGKVDNGEEIVDFINRARLKRRLSAVESTK